MFYRYACDGGVLSGFILKSAIGPRKDRSEAAVVGKIGLDERSWATQRDTEERPLSSRYLTSPYPRSSFTYSARKLRSYVITPLKLR